MKNFFIFLIFANSCNSGFSQVNTDIILFNLAWKKGELRLSQGINVTKRIGYDNQPHFDPANPLLYYSSFDDSGRSDLKVYQFKKGSTSSITKTREREYSPNIVPGGKFVSCIIQRDNGAQDLGIYPVKGGEPMVLIDHLIVGYHSWYTKDKVLLFVLEKNEGSSLRLYSLSTKTDTILARNIGRSLHRIPGTNSMSFIQKNSDGVNTITSIDMATLGFTKLTETIPGQDHLCWLNNNIVLMSDGKNKLFWKKIAEKSEWKEVSIETKSGINLKGVSRLATDLANKRLAIVVNE